MPLSYGNRFALWTAGPPTKTWALIVARADVSAGDGSLNAHKHM